MTTPDYVIIAAILISALIGAARGLLREGIALVTWVIALILAWHFADLVEPHLGGVLATPAVKPWVARLVVLGGALLVGALIGAVVTQFVRLSIFTGMDRLMGFAFGALRGLLLFGIFVMLGQLLRLDKDNWWRESHLIPVGESIANGVRFLVGDGAQPHSRDVQV
jgi:membrane protein required for colicin V production